VGRVKGVGGWVNDAPDTGDQVVCTVGQTNEYSSPDHTTRRADIEWYGLRPQATLLMHPSGPIGSILFLHGLIGPAKAICKSRPSYL